MSEMSYDEKCYDLAIAFLQDYRLSEDRTKKYAHELAQNIQRTIEDYLEAELKS